MRLDISGKNYEVPPRLQEILQKKFDRLDKYFRGNEVRAKILCRADKAAHTMEVTLYSKSDVLRAEVSCNEMYDNVDLVMPKIERQIIKLHTKHHNKQKKNISKEREFFADTAAREFFFDKIEERNESPVKKKIFELEPIGIDEAIVNLQLVDHDFYVFQNIENHRVCVVYKRDDGEFGLIEAAIK